MLFNGTHIFAAYRSPYSYITSHLISSDESPYDRKRKSCESA